MMEKADILELSHALTLLSDRQEKVRFHEFEISLGKGFEPCSPLSELSDTVDSNEERLVAWKYNNSLSSRCHASESANDEILNSTAKTTETRISSETGDSGLSTLEGSPLKLLAIADLSAINCAVPASKLESQKLTRKRYDSVSSKRARYLLSLYYAVVSQHPDNIEFVTKRTRPLWVLCDGKQPGNVVCLSLAVNKESIPDNNSNNCLVHRSSIVTMSGPSPGRSLSKVFFDQNKSTRGKQSKCRAEYDVMGSLSKENPMAGLQGSIKLEVSWGSSQHLLQIPPIDADTTAKVQIATGDTRSPCFTLYSELDILRRLIQSLTTGEISWAARDQSKPLIDELKAVLKSLVLGHSKPANKTAIDDTIIRTGEETMELEERNDQDFTDFMWIVLKGCSSYVDLVDCFQFVFNKLKSGDLQPMVHRSNKTNLAQIVRDSYTGRVDLPRFSAGTPAIEMLAEIGLEKLTRDYLNIFISKDLASPKHLEYFSERNLIYEEKLKRLEKLHCILELMIILRNFLNTPHTTLSTCARQTLQYMEANDLDWKRVFEIQIPTTSVAKLLESQQPYLWQCCETVRDRNLDESVSKRLSSDPPFQHLDYLPSLLDTSQGDTTLALDGDYYMLNIKNSVVLM